MKKAKKVLIGMLLSLSLLGLGTGVASAATTTTSSSSAQYYIDGKEVSQSQFESHMNWLLESFGAFCSVD